jgi:ArsR family transcriptional regulator
VKLAEGASSDPVVADALVSGRALCEADGSLGRIADVIRARDAVAREFFAQPGAGTKSGEAVEGAVPAELGAYLRAFAPLLGRTELAIDAGTGDGGLLEVLAPIYDRVVAVDRSEAQLARAKARAGARGWKNVELVQGELDGDAVKRAIGGAQADAVFAVRLLHHAPRPVDFMRQLADLCRPGGALVVLDYGRHDDESMRTQADLWLGFDPRELRRLASEVGFEDVRVTDIPRALCGRGPDAHLPWQAMVAKMSEGKGLSKIRESKNGKTERKTGNSHG